MCMFLQVDFCHVRYSFSNFFYDASICYTTDVWISFLFSTFSNLENVSAFRNLPG